MSCIVFGSTTEAKSVHRTTPEGAHIYFLAKRSVDKVLNHPHPPTPKKNPKSEVKMQNKTTLEGDLGNHQ